MVQPMRTTTHWLVCLTLFVCLLLLLLLLLLRGQRKLHHICVPAQPSEVVRLRGTLGAGPPCARSFTPARTRNVIIVCRLAHVRAGIVRGASLLAGDPCSAHRSRTPLPACARSTRRVI